MNPLFSHPQPPRRPRNLVMAPQEPDRAGLAAMLTDTKSKVWPVEDAPGISEVPSQNSRLQGPVTRNPFDVVPEKSDFVDPSTLGILDPLQRHVLPNVMRRPLREGMMDMQEPVAEDEYRALIRRLWEGAHHPSRQL